MAAGTENAARQRLGLAPPFGQLTFVWLRMAVILGLGVAIAIRLRIYTTETYFFWRQDLPVLVLGLGLLIGLGLAPARWLTPFAALLERRPRLWVAGLALICFVAGLIGPWLVFEGYTFSLDEVMANFDAKIFASGRLVAPVAPEWRPFMIPMQPIFMLPFPGGDSWASSYLPVNAAIRALASLVGARALVNPLLSAFSIVATYAVGRRLWPDERQSALIAAALLGGSAQLIVTSMTSYAMPVHLALNMAWLWLFLRGGRMGHAGALVLGFFACGIHQVVFHPLFAAPWVLQLWLDRRWRLAGLYTVAYAAMCLFWIEYWAISQHLLGVAPAAAGSAGAGYFISRALEVVRTIRLSNVGPMGECLVRFVSWQNPLVAPLALAGALAAERAKGQMRALVLGVFLTLVAMLMLEPTQTHGWGYRYLHGLLGSIALLAAWSWRRMTWPLPAERRAAAAGGLVLACAVSLCLLTPLRAWQTWAYVDPYARADAAIALAKTDVVVVDDEDALAFNFGTLVRNDPFLTNTPKTMALAAMDDDDVRRLCAAHPKLLIFDGPDAAAYGIDVVPGKPDQDVQDLRDLMEDLNCGVEMPPPAR
ncbi:MAG TPA: hypothetical protein VHW60_11195 [Caulobacteraceae bacterium]|nr:hypothetical protein [Caulobacteraceae bacterium]